MLEIESLKAKMQFNEGWKEARQNEVAFMEKAGEGKQRLLERQN